MRMSLQKTAYIDLYIETDNQDDQAREDSGQSFDLPPDRLFNLKQYRTYSVDHYRNS